MTDDSNSPETPLVTPPATPLEPPLVTLDRRADGVALVTLDNGKVNALSSGLLAELGAIAADLTADPPGAVVITGGPKIFAAGADITEFGGPREAYVVGSAFRSALAAVASVPRVTIAAINGVALGGGCELTLACDFRVASTRARFGQPEILLGIIPGGGGTQRLARLVGVARAKELILSGRQIDAAEAARIGLVDELIEVSADGDAVTDRACELAARYAAGPLAVQALAKRAIDEGIQGILEDGIALEQELFVEAFGTEDARIGVKSFLEHGPGKAEFTGR